MRRKLPKSKFTKLNDKVMNLFGSGVKTCESYLLGTNLVVRLEGRLDWQGGMLDTLNKLRTYTKSEDVHLADNRHVNGCETCDFGGYDVWEFTCINTKLN